MNTRYVNFYRYTVPPASVDMLAQHICCDMGHKLHEYLQELFVSDTFNCGIIKKMKIEISFAVTRH